MGYYNKNGIVGQYRGVDVFVIGDKELTRKRTEATDTIFAVRSEQNKLDLVQRGQLIGEMDDSGRVEIYKRRTEYRYYKPQEVKREAPEWTFEKRVSAEPEDLVLNVEFGYGAYSKVVDNFFKGLDKLWAELEV